ncbi:hypothetical protein KGQ20_04190 [Catenulispora sp. NF23]|uniref:Uncharacterized protein n=1 Tax=Catenulispora pinistramenti TaxID=2705254 RepID=A0ABS5KJE7_9ACTN|nr:hypothetical protein [Catenulispora pinistramenti]MBS2531964.1 hypothetical protein [Catenulispora pinistramenti]MBS2546232.1 hypothetical protein [Catenulispora pinistramenti]
MSRTPPEAAVASLPLKLGGELRILSEDVDLARGTVRWMVRGPHITGVVWLTREDPWDLDDPDGPANFRCRMYSGDSTGIRDRRNDVIRTDPLTCYGVPASRYRLGERMAHLPELAADVIPDRDDYAGVTASARRVVDVRHALARYALGAPWLSDLLWTWRLQTAVKISARASADRARQLDTIRAARAAISRAEAVLDSVAAEFAEAAERGTAPLARDGFDLLSPVKAASEQPTITTLACPAAPHPPTSENLLEVRDHRRGPGTTPPGTHHRDP